MFRNAEISSASGIDKERRKEKRGRSFSMPANAELSPDHSPPVDHSVQSGHSNSNPSIANRKVGRNRKRDEATEPPALSASSFRNLSDSWRKGESTDEWYKVIHSEGETNDELFPVLLRPPLAQNRISPTPSLLPSPNLSGLNMGDNSNSTIPRTAVLSPFKEDEAKPNLRSFLSDSIG
mmetsp:Transcript_3304/g.4071  ORF Transcript_3304/g.4071 Transcript_3304/m.4071 type:complete len:179 (-) Transcript_3304:44-580(-)